MAHESPAPAAGPGRIGAARVLRRLLFTIAVVVAGVYAAAVGYLVSQETRLVFDAGRPLAAGRPEPPFEQVELDRVDGARQFAWVLRHASSSSTAPWLLYLHGNQATVASRVNIVRYEGLRALGLNLLAPEYRGFGGLDGIPSESAVTMDARAGYDYLRRTLGIGPERIVIFGWSLGSAVAVNLAADVEAAAVILEGAPASVVAIGAREYPWMPVRLVMRNTFESIVRVPRIGSPMLFLHARTDEIIPIDDGRRLFDAAPEPKTFVELRGGHVDVAEVDMQRYFDAVREFLRLHGVLPTVE